MTIVRLIGILLFIIYACCITLCCTKTIIRVPNYYIDPRLEPYYQEFLQEAKDHDVKIVNTVAKIEVSKIENDEDEEGSITLGICSKLIIPVFDPLTGEVVKLYDYRTITINEKYIKNPYIIRYSMGHELGHGFLDLPHIDDEESIMDPYMPSIPMDEAWWKKAWDDAFNYYKENIE